jgi:hypothetical protein
MVAAGDRVGEAHVWTAPGESRTLAELVGERRALLLFYLFDWSST